ncbi:hypothetical protein RKD28_003969 [Streptomyces sp. SAI-229]
MTNQPYEAYDPYQDPQRAQGVWPGQQQAYGDPYADQQYTQQWQGQTWETQMQQPVRGGCGPGGSDGLGPGPGGRGPGRF